LSDADFGGRHTQPGMAMTPYAGFGPDEQFVLVASAGPLG
jgi:hypothetical protein